MYNKDKLYQRLENIKNKRSTNKSKKYTFKILNVSPTFIDRTLQNLLKGNKQIELKLYPISRKNFMYVIRIHIINTDNIIKEVEAIRYNISLIFDKIEHEKPELVEEVSDVVNKILDEIKKIDELIPEKLLTKKGDKALFECNILHDEECPVCNFITALNIIQTNPDIINVSSAFNFVEMDEEEIEEIVFNRQVNIIEGSKLNIFMNILHLFTSNIYTMYKYCFYGLDEKNTEYIVCFDKNGFEILSDNIIKFMEDNAITSIDEIFSISLLIKNNEDNCLEMKCYLNTNEDFSISVDEIKMINTINKINTKAGEEFYIDIAHYFDDLINLMQEFIFHS